MPIVPSIWLVVLTCCAAFADETFEFSPAKTADNGVRTHTITSSHQRSTTSLRVLLSPKIKPGEKVPAVYLLPVEPGTGRRWGDPLAEVLRHKLHEKHKVVFVVPTFADLPWYANHPSDPRLQQETYFLKHVLPAVEKEYPVTAERSGRLLVGFSKSGWGALTLLLRHPDTFEKAAAWDTPLMQAKPNRFGMGPIFGTQANFEGYYLSRLLSGKLTGFGAAPRFAILGMGNFQQHHEQLHRQLSKAKIPHAYTDGPRRRHHWESGWLPEAVQWVVNGKRDENREE